MMLRKSLVLALAILITVSGLGLAQTRLAFDRYHQPAEVVELLNHFSARYPALASVKEIGKSAAGTALHVLEIADRAVQPLPASRPGILVCANLEGNHLIGTEAALLIAQKLLAGYEANPGIKDLLAKKAVYIVPLLNPDAAASYFTTPQLERLTNGNQLDDDVDAAVDEDGPEDLNNDGRITMMRVKDPEGEWMPDPDDARLLRRADPQKAEVGIYKLYVEGIDNDQDEAYNEDPAGGVRLNRNFPHDFEINNAESGRWPVSQPESIALVEFMLAHRNIALVLNFSSENTFLNLEQTGKPRPGAEKVKVPGRFASRLGIDPEQEFDLKELTELIKASGLFGGIEVTEERVAQIVGSGPAMSLDRQDQQIFEAVQKDFKESLKSAHLDYPEKKAVGVGKGSFLAYCYYHYGVPVFSSDLWAIPETKKQAEKGDGKSAEAAERAPGNSGSASENTDLDALRWSDSALAGKGFLAWTPFEHPTLGPVEIGGFLPFVKTLPPPELMEKQIGPQADFYIQLMGRVAGLSITETKVKRLDDHLFVVTCYLANPGWFPTSTAQGRRAGTSWPVRVSIATSADQVLFSGRPIESIPFLAGGGDVRKVEWTVSGKQGSTVQISADSPKLGIVTTQATLR